jgi:hypothetical protein
MTASRVGTAFPAGGSTAARAAGLLAHTEERIMRHTIHRDAPATGVDQYHSTRPTSHPPTRRRQLAWAGASLSAALVVGAVPSGAATEADAASPSTDAAVIWEWNQIAMDVLTPSGRPLLTQPFVVTAMHVAMYDAVVSIEGTGAPLRARIAAAPQASAAAAAAAAAHGVLVGFLPGSAAPFDTALVESLAAIPDGPAEQQGVAVGRAAARATLADRLDDGTQSGPLPPVRPAGAGVWAPTPPATTGLTPWLAFAEPYSMRSPDQFRPPAPPALGSARYQRDLDEVGRLGGLTSTERTAAQTTTARFWADQPIAQNQRTLRNHAAQLGWDLAATARLFAAVLTSEADALIACWDAKYHYQLWRPWQSVPSVQPGWVPLLGTPNHPEYPSAHGCLTGALGHALARVMGTTAIDLDIDAANIGVTRHYATLGELLHELGEARIWGGLHYRFSVEAGLHIARKVVSHNLGHHFHPLPRPASTSTR